MFWGEIAQAGSLSSAGIRLEVVGLVGMNIIQLTDLHRFTQI